MIRNLFTRRCRSDRRSFPRSPELFQFAACLLALGVSLTACKEVKAGRGEILRMEPLGTFSVSQIEEIKKSFGMDFPSGKYAVSLRRIVYGTVDVHGEPVNASGLMIVPEGVNSPLPVLSFQHGVSLNRSQVPSSAKGADVLLLAGYFAANGYIALAPDYLGLGESPGFHPYLHAESEAAACADLLKAVGALPDLRFSGKLFLTGYSQGAHATMALERYIEKSGGLGTPFKLTAVSGMSGPYDLSTVSFPALLRAPSQASVVYLAYLIFSMDRSYGLFPDLSAAVQPPYDQTVDSVFDGKHQADEIMKRLPSTPAELLQPKLLAALRKDPKHPLNAAIKKNDVYDWKPLSHVRLYYGKADRDVPPENTLKASARMKAFGADVLAINVGDALDHQTAVLPAFSATYQWFESLK